MKKRFLAALATGLLVVGMGGVAQALSTSDMTLGGSNATAVLGPFVGNDKQLDPDVFNDPSYFNLAGSDFEYFTDYQANGAVSDDYSYFGYNFDLAWSGTTYYDDEDKEYKVDLTSGTFTLSWSGQPLPTNFDFIFGLKASRKYALYFFDDFLLTNDPYSTDGTYKVTFAINTNGNVQDLSHMTVYGRTGAPVPEPATMLLFGTGLAGLAAVARRRKN